MIDPLGGSALPAGMYGTGLPSPAQFRRTVAGSAAQALGQSVQDVQSALRGGASLADLARQNGVATDRVVSAVAQAIASLDPGRGGLPGAPDATAMAQRIVERKGGLSGRRDLAAAVGAADPGSVSGVDDSWSPHAIVASALRMSVDELHAAVASGTSIADLIVQHAQVSRFLRETGQSSTVDVRA